REYYDQCLYIYTKFDTTQHCAKFPSDELSNTLVKAFKDKLKTD
ncbi:MAG: transcriptional regulator, partial [Lachnospiraceae bacterium]|nr:transcriptional regulator [Lachnospiraceae bacterium]